MNDKHELQTRQTIVRLLSSMASAKEINQYLKRFSQQLHAFIEDRGAP